MGYISYIIYVAPQRIIILKCETRGNIKFQWGCGRVEGCDGFAALAQSRPEGEILGKLYEFYNTIIIENLTKKI